MATVEHCIYCFETLASSLESRKPMSLGEVEKSWARFVQSAGGDAPSAAPSKRLPALRRLAEDSSGASSAMSSTTSLEQQQQGDGADTPMTSTSSLSPTPPPVTSSPLFVTWNTVAGNALRGCIGTFEDQPLDEGLSDYALTSALHDTRFNPVAARELPGLEVVVTLLTDFEDAQDAMDWVLGTHGLRISFYYHGRRYGSTYLPDVAPEQGWTKEETVVSLMRKAGWMGRREKWRDVELKVVRYQGKTASARYPEYKQWRDWVDKKGKE